jgi:hypothetical protein
VRFEPAPPGIDWQFVEASHARCRIEKDCSDPVAVQSRATILTKWRALSLSSECPMAGFRKQKII